MKKTLRRKMIEGRRTPSPLQVIEIEEADPGVGRDNPPKKAKVKHAKK